MSLLQQFVSFAFAWWLQQGPWQWTAQPLQAHHLRIELKDFQAHLQYNFQQKTTWLTKCRYLFY